VPRFCRPSFESLFTFRGRDETASSACWIRVQFLSLPSDDTCHRPVLLAPRGYLFQTCIEQDTSSERCCPCKRGRIVSKYRGRRRCREATKLCRTRMARRRNGTRKYPTIPRPVPAGTTEKKVSPGQTCRTETAKETQNTYKCTRVRSPCVCCIVSDL